MMAKPAAVTPFDNPIRLRADTAAATNLIPPRSIPSDPHLTFSNILPKNAALGHSGIKTVNNRPFASWVGRCLGNSRSAHRIEDLLALIRAVDERLLEFYTLHHKRFRAALLL
jgi:hypothetical protein